MEKQGDENWWIQSKMEKHGVDGPAIGIHLGATFSCVAVRNNSGAVTTIQNDQGGYTTPCYVAFRDMETLVGEAAKNQAFRNPANTIFDAKRLIGRKWSDPCVQNDIKNWPFKVISSSADDKPVIVVREGAWEKRLAPEDISAAILRKMKQSAEAFLGCSICRAVVTVPACFNDSQRRSTTLAGAMAGFRILRVIDEPTAAARAYGLGEDGPKKVLVFDLGGRTLQVSIVKILHGKVEIIATGEDDHLGGEDFDSRMVAHLAGDFRRKHGQDITRNAKAMRRLRRECESAKRDLTAFSQQSIYINSLHDGIDLNARITRAMYQSLNADLFDKCMEVVRRCLDGAKMERNSIDDVVLVGGSTRMPKVKDMLAELFGEKTTIHDGISPEEVLAVGAAVAAAELGDEEQGDEIIISCSEMVADENLTPLSLGVRDVHGVMKVLVPRNTRIPVTKELRWTITEKNISSVSLPIYEGERAMARDNNLLGSLRLDGISSSTPAHSPSLKIMLRVDADGTLGISAEDMISAHKAEVTVRRARDRLTQVEIYAMIAEAETYWSEEDERKRLVTKCRLKGCLCTALAKSAASSPKFAMESGFLEVMLDCHGPNVGLHQPDQIENLRMRRWGPEGPVIGIDLGTTNSRVGVWTFYNVEIVANADGSRLTPSCVAFKGKQVLVGDAAKLQASTNRENTIFEAKRLMGRRWTDRCVQYDAKRWPFRVIPGADGKPLVAVRDGTKENYLAAEEISAAILGNMKRSAEAVLRCPVSRAVLTVPACFDDSQRQSAVAAGAIAGLEIVRIVDEPTAAAVAYGLDSGQRKVLVFSLGGGSLDVSILEISNGKVGVVSAGGDGHLGGESINSRLVSYLAGDFRDKHGRDVTRNAVAMRRLRDASEAAKRGYAAAPLQEIAVEGLHDGIDYHTWLTRAKFERLNMGLFRRCIDIVQQCIGNAKVDKGSIDDIVLVGGSTRILKVQEMLREFFAGKTLHSSLSPEETVAIGAAVQAARTVFGRTDPLPAQGFLL